MIDWKPLEHAQAYDIIDRIYAADGGEDVSRSCSLSGEPVMYNLMTQSSDPRPHLSSFESWQLNQEKSAYRKKYLDYWQATASQTGTGRPVDAVIAPVSNWASCPHDTNDYVGYTTQWNLLVSVSSPCSLLPHTHTTYCSPTPPPPPSSQDRPCVVFPVTHVDPSLDAKSALSAPYTIPGIPDAEFWERYDPQRWAGLPVNLQIVGKRLQDEELLGLARVLREAGCTCEPK